MFRYITDAEAATEKAKREADLEKVANARSGASSGAAPTSTGPSALQPQATAPAQQAPGTAEAKPVAPSPNH